MNFEYSKELVDKGAELEALGRQFELLCESEKYIFVEKKSSEGWLYVDLSQIEYGENVGEEFLVSPQKRHLFSQDGDRWNFKDERISFWWSPEDEEDFLEDEDFIIL